MPSARQMRSRASLGLRVYASRPAAGLKSSFALGAPVRGSMKGSCSRVIPSSERYQVWSPGCSSCMGPSDSTRTAMTKLVRLTLSQNSAPIYATVCPGRR